jgi:hypothetical protein
MSDNNNKSNGIGIGMILFLIFLVLKLAKIGEVADWSWWWVTSPLWIPIVALVIFLVLAFIWALISDM